MRETNKKSNEFVGYEHKEVTVSNRMEQVYSDGYVNFGWIPDGTLTHSRGASLVTLKFKRDRNIRNKAELTRLQRQFEGCVSEIEMMERLKGLTASIAAYVIGLIGTAFMAGSMFAYKASLLPLSILLAVPGFIGWIASYPCYRTVRKRKTRKMDPLISAKQDEIYETCKKAFVLLPEVN